ncbi:MAG: alpha/beta fold hydrolase [Candidatus Binataceae bacterium]
MPEDKFQTAGGLKLHYLDFGGAGKPALVCLHGLTGNAHNFDALAPHLAARYRVLALDVRGRGDSAWGPALDYNPQVYVSDLKEFLDALGIKRVSLIGTSMGGVVSMMFAGGYPEIVEHLVLNDIGPEIDPAGLTRIMTYVPQAPDHLNDLGELRAYFRETYPPANGVSDAALNEWVRWSVKPAEDGGLTWKMDPAIRRPPRGGSAARPIDLWLHYNRVMASILIVRGAESDILSRETAARMLKVQRGVRLVEVPGVGHTPTLIEPVAREAITEFLGVSA